jgi:hypothetical protein
VGNFSYVVRVSEIGGEKETWCGVVMEGLPGWVQAGRRRLSSLHLSFRNLDEI